MTSSLGCMFMRTCMYVSEYVHYWCVNTCTCTYMSNDVWSPEVGTGCLSHLLSTFHLEAGSFAELRASTDSAAEIPCFSPLPQFWDWCGLPNPPALLYLFRALLFRVSANCFLSQNISLMGQVFFLVY